MILNVIFFLPKNFLVQEINLSFSDVTLKRQNSNKSKGFGPRKGVTFSSCEEENGDSKNRTNERHLASKSFTKLKKKPGRKKVCKNCESLSCCEGYYRKVIKIDLWL